MLRLAFRNLVQNRMRLMISTGGVALALVLILVLDAIFVGVERQVTAYMDHSSADVFVSQSGVRNLHMASSWIPESTVAEVAKVPGVASVTPILYLSNPLTIGQERYPAYIIGLPPDAEFGTPWRMREGTRIPGEDEAVIDASIADKAGIGIGDSVTVLGQRFTVAGLSEETSSLVNSIAFISAADFARASGTTGAVSFVLATVSPGQHPETVAARIETELGGVTAQSRRQFAEQERRTVRDMATDLIAIMNAAGLLIGLAVMALTVYTATLSRRAEFGVLKALGTRNRQLYGLVLGQAFYSVSLGLALALAVTLILSALVPTFAPNLVLALSSASLVKVAVMAAIIAGIAAILPVRQIAALDPAMVFRRSN
jgi:putative ABC transport system permease protein